MNIVFCTDNQLEQVGTSMTSIFELTNEPITVYLFSAIKSPELINLHKLTNSYGQEFKHILVDKSKIPFLKTINIKEDCHQGLCKLLPDSAYYRWLIPEYLKHNKCLYLDTDIIANKDITSFYNMDIDKFSVVGSSAKRRSPEIISGIMLMNLIYFRQNNVYEQFCNKVIEEHNNGQMVNDQRILNLVLKDSIYNIYELNLQALPQHMMNYYSISEFTFVHYSDFYKPWKKPVLFDHLWFKYNTIYKEKLQD